MVKNAELRELARKIKPFVGITDDTLGDPSFVDLLTQIINLRLNVEKVQGAIGAYQQNVDKHITEFLNFRNTTIQQLEGWRRKLKPSFKDCCIVSGSCTVQFKSC